MNRLPYGMWKDKPSRMGLTKYRGEITLLRSSLSAEPRVKELEPAAVWVTRCQVSVCPAPGCHSDTAYLETPSWFAKCSQRGLRSVTPPPWALVLTSTRWGYWVAARILGIESSKLQGGTPFCDQTCLLPADQPPPPQLLVHSYYLHLPEGLVLLSVPL